MTTANAYDFAEAAQSLGMQYLGTYDGRGFHKGIAVGMDNAMDLADLIGEISAMPELEPLHGLKPDHTDSLGRGVLFSWNRSRFDADSIIEAEGRVDD